MGRHQTKEPEGRLFSCDNSGLMLTKKDETNGKTNLGIVVCNFLNKSDLSFNGLPSGPVCSTPLEKIKENTNNRVPRGDA